MNWKKFLAIVAVQLSVFSDVRRRNIEMFAVVNLSVYCLVLLVTANSLEFIICGTFDEGKFEVNDPVERVIETLRINCFASELNEPIA